MRPYHAVGPVEIWHGDSRHLLEGVETSADRENTVVLTDPPWPGCDVDIVGSGTDALELWQEVAPLLADVASRLIVQISSLTDPRGILDAVPDSLPYATTTWLRYVPTAYRGCFLHGGDVAHVFGKQRLNPGTRVLPAECVARSQSRWRGDHPCPRNLDHLRWLVGWYTAKSELVIDPFAGSGTTLVACLEVGKRAVGIEIDERWCEEAACRLDEANRQGRICLDAATPPEET